MAGLGGGCWRFWWLGGWGVCEVIGGSCWGLFLEGVRGVLLFVFYVLYRLAAEESNECFPPSDFLSTDAQA